MTVEPEHIGVITPYHAQRCKILDLLNKDVTLRGIKVGSVEEFQGQVRFFFTALVSILILIILGTSSRHNLDCSQQQRIY